MPRHLISDAHEWINEIPTVPREPHPIPHHRHLSSFSLPQGRFLLPLLQFHEPPSGVAAGATLRQPRAMAASPNPRQPDSPLPAVPHFPTTVHPSSSTSGPPPINPKSPPNPPVSTHSSHATTSISTPAFSADPPPPRDPFPPLPTARPSPAATSAIPSSTPLLVQPPPPHSLAVAAGNRPTPSPIPSREPLQPFFCPLSTASAHPSRSYAQVSKGLKGSGFVRNHASEIESFARLPRTGANIICGSKEGIPSFSIGNSDLARVEELYSNALVMKFHGGRPSLEVSHKEIQSWGIEQPFTIGPLSSRAFLLRFQDNKDLIRVLSRPSSILITFPYKIFRWHNLCHIKEDSCYAPVWISMPRLPLQCFIPEFLEAVANRIGRFLCFDKATATLARPSTARMCIELDLRKSPPPFIWVGLFEGLKQPIIYERVPKFCSRCIAQGHTAEDCPSGHREAIKKQAVPNSNPIHGRTPPARQNATRQSPTESLHQQASSATTHIHAIPTPPPPPPDAAPQATGNLLSAPSSAAGDVVQPRPPPDPTPPATTTPTPPPPPPAPAPPATTTHKPALSPTAEKADQPSSLVDSLPSSSPASNSPIHQLALNELSSLCSTQGHTVTVCPSGQREAAPKQPDPGSTSIRGCTPPARQKAPKASSTTSAPQNASKPIKLKQLDKDQHSSLNQQQQEALERFKQKVRAQTQSLGQQLIGSNSVNPFEALIENQSDDGDDDYYAASFNSDTDEDLVEPMDMGYQSADGRSSHNHTKSSAPVMKTNKRHPNIPLNVRLRARKNSYSSSHKYLCM